MVLRKFDAIYTFIHNTEHNNSVENEYHKGKRMHKTHLVI